MEFSQSPKDVHMHAKFAHFRLSSYGYQIDIVIHLKILHECIIFQVKVCEKNGKDMKIHHTCVVIINDNLILKNI